MDLAAQVVLVVKNLPVNAEDIGSTPGAGSYPEVGRGNPLQFSPVSMPGESHGQRNLAGYSPQGHKELDTT